MVALGRVALGVDLKHRPHSEKRPNKLQSAVPMCPHATLDWRRTQPDAVVSAAVERIVVGGTQCGATKRVRGVPMLGGWRVQMNPPAGTFDGVPWAMKRAIGVPKRARRSHANCTSGTFGGAPYGATKRVRGVPKRA
eukprot:617186-Pyramimonas_sp.AAC.1